MRGKPSAQSCGVEAAHFDAIAHDRAQLLIEIASTIAGVDQSRLRTLRLQTGDDMIETLRKRLEFSRNALFKASTLPGEQARDIGRIGNDQFGRRRGRR